MRKESNPFQGPLPIVLPTPFCLSKAYQNSKASFEVWSQGRELNPAASSRY